MSRQDYQFAKQAERQEVPFNALIMAAMVQATVMTDWQKLKFNWPDIAQECVGYEQATQRRMEP